MLNPYHKTATDGALDVYTKSVQNLPTFGIYELDPVTHKPVPWAEFRGGDLAAELVIRESALALQVATCAAQIAQWGLLAAKAQRIWEVEQRLERQWKASVLTAALSEADKKLTEKQQEALYRSKPEYEVHKEAVERAAEALQSAQAVLDGFRSKAALLRAAVRPAPNGSYDPQSSLP